MLYTSMSSRASWSRVSRKVNRKFVALSDIAKELQAVQINTQWKKYKQNNT